MRSHGDARGLLGTYIVFWVCTTMSRSRLKRRDDATTVETRYANELGLVRKWE
jgi:hypothetical protein